MKNQVKIETVRKGESYIGRVAVYTDGRRLYTYRTNIKRLTREDALRDAEQEANDMVSFDSQTFNR